MLSNFHSLDRFLKSGVYIVPGMFLHAGDTTVRKRTPCIRLVLHQVVGQVPGPDRGQASCVTQWKDDTGTDDCHMRLQGIMGAFR